MTATSSFLENPVGYAKEHVILPSKGSADTSTMKAKTVAPDLTLYQVKGENRVLYAHLEAAAKGNAFDVDFSEAQLSKDWFATYWLPWYTSETYRITLRPSKKNLLNADFFFTAALTGCTVHVDGDPWEPTVYHSNAASLPVKVPLSKEKNAELYKMSTKVLHMESAIKASQIKFPKGASHYKPRSATVFDYAPDLVSPSDIDLLKKQQEKKLDAEPDSVMPALGATVFGVKSQTHGLWSFYYQSWTLINYSKGDLRLRTYFVNSCRRFWPGDDISKPIPIVFEKSEESDENY